MKTYSELITLPTFKDRYEYLRLSGIVGEETFGFDRILNQKLYRSPEWKHIRNEIILRDEACDLAIPDRDIIGRVLIHHINPITERDILDRHPKIFDPDNLVCVSHNTHQAIHYGDESLLYLEVPERSKGDTKLW